MNIAIIYHNTKHQKMYSSQRFPIGQDHWPRMLPYRTGPLAPDPTLYGRTIGLGCYPIGQDRWPWMLPL